MNELDFSVDLKNPNVHFLHGTPIMADGAGDCRVSVFGDFYGVIENNKKLLPEQGIGWLAERARDRSIFRRIHAVVGPCVVVVERPRGVEVMTSFSAPGLYYSESETNIRFVWGERNAWSAFSSVSKPLDDWAIYNAVVSHQLLARPPFRSVIEGVKKLPCATRLSIQPGEAKVETALAYLIDQVHDSIRAPLTHLGPTLALIGTAFPKQVLSYSGGIDSSLLLALLVEHDVQLDKAHYLPMKGPHNIPYRTGVEVADFLRVPIVHATERKLDAESLEADCRAGLSVMYGGLSKLFRPPNALNNFKGQNADTVYQIDVHAAGRGSVGARYYYHSWRTAARRIHWTVPYMQGAFFARLVRGDGMAGRLSREALINAQVYATSEHERPTRTPQPKDGFREWRTKVFVEDIVHAIDNTAKIDWKNLSPRQELVLHKIVRWYRSVANVYDIESANRCRTGLRSAHPFSEGPVARDLLLYLPGYRDAFDPKSNIYRTFERSTGKSYMTFKRRALKRREPPAGGIDRSELARRMHHAFDDFHRKRTEEGHTTERILLRMMQNHEPRKKLNEIYQSLAEFNTNDLSRSMPQYSRLWNMDLLVRDTIQQVHVELPA